MRTTLLAGLLVCALVLTGCGKSAEQPPFPDVHPVKGVVKRGGAPVKGGSVRFIPEPETNQFVINSDIKDDGTYSLVTLRTTDKAGERKTGAPAGPYKVLYIPAAGDQTAGAVTEPVELPKPVTVKAGDNDIPIDLPKK
jgi:hypothetical protein